MQGESYIGIELPHDAQTLNLDWKWLHGHP